MPMASCVSPLISLSGGSHVKAQRLSSTNLSLIHKSSALTIQTKSNRSHRFSVSARHRGSSDFVSGFLLGSATIGTLAYIFAPEIRRSLLNENEHGFKKQQLPPKYFEEGLEKTRETLNEKINQLNSAIDNFSSRVSGSGGKSGGESGSLPSSPIETDPEVEATA